MYEYPPILTGSEQQQLLALRDYLVRLAKSMETAETAASGKDERAAAGTAPAKKAGVRDEEEKLVALRRNAARSAGDSSPTPARARP